MIAAIVANPSIDRLFLVEQPVRAGAIHRPAELVATAGGKGLNVARAAATLGEDVTAVVLLAGHAGRWIEAELETAGVQTDAVWSRGETRTSLTATDANSARPTEFYERGEPVDADAWVAFAARVDALGTNPAASDPHLRVLGADAGTSGARQDGTDADAGATGAAPDATGPVAGSAAHSYWAALSGSLPPGIMPAESADLVRRARAAGARIAVDQHGATLAAAIDGAADLVKVNEHEARELTAATDARQAALALHARLADTRAGVGLPPGAAIVTAGEAGAILIAPDGAAWRATLGVRGPFPTGSGDAFLAGLLVALDPLALDTTAATWRAALPLAMGAAAANAEVAGAGRLDPGRARTLAARVAVERA